MCTKHTLFAPKKIGPKNIALLKRRSKQTFQPINVCIKWITLEVSRVNHGRLQAFVCRSKNLLRIFHHFFDILAVFSLAKLGYAESPKKKHWRHKESMIRNTRLARFTSDATLCGSAGGCGARLQRGIRNQYFGRRCAPSKACTYAS